MLYVYWWICQLAMTIDVTVAQDWYEFLQHVSCVRLVLNYFLKQQLSKVRQVLLAAEHLFCTTIKIELWIFENCLLDSLLLILLEHRRMKVCCTIRLNMKSNWDINRRSWKNSIDSSSSNISSNQISSRCVSMAVPCAFYLRHYFLYCIIILWAESCKCSFCKSWGGIALA